MWVCVGVLASAGLSDFVSFLFVVNPPLEPLTPGLDTLHGLVLWLAWEAWSELVCRSDVNAWQVLDCLRSGGGVGEAVVVPFVVHPRGDIWLAPLALGLDTVGVGVSLPICGLGCSASIARASLPW